MEDKPFHGSEDQEMGEGREQSRNDSRRLIEQGFWKPVYDQHGGCSEQGWRQPFGNNHAELNESGTAGCPKE